MLLFLRRRCAFKVLDFLRAPLLRMATAAPPDSDGVVVEGSEEVEEMEEVEEPKKGAKKTAGKGRARKRGKPDEAGEEDDAPPPAKRGKKAAGGGGEGKKKKGGSKKETGTVVTSKPLNSKVTDWAIIPWTELGTTADDRSWSVKFSSWNVNGVRAWLKNGGFEYLTHEDPDIFCLQEIKCSDHLLPKGDLHIPGYHIYWYPANEPGYSGTGIYSKVKPLTVSYGMGIDKHDNEGRLITCEFENYYFLTAYVPNAGEGLKRLTYRQEWDVDFRAYMKALDEKKPVILCGDLNVAHEEIDLKNPKTNHRTAGFTNEEREAFTALLKEGFVDTFRHLYPDRQAFTYWSYRFNARTKNIGWRLDYFVVSERLLKDVCDVIIRSPVKGSDHCPLLLTMATS